MSAAMYFYGSILAVPVCCVWVTIMTWRITMRQKTRRAAVLRSLLAYLLPLGIYAILAAVNAGLSVDGQWTWLGETMKVSLMQDFTNNLYLFIFLTIPFGLGYGVLGLASWGITAWSFRNARPQQPPRGNPDMPF